MSQETRGWARGAPCGSHGLRHSFASILIMRGEPATRVANLLGHSSPAVTMKVYAHWFKDRQSNAVNDLARELFAPEASTGGVY
jgi:integrase